MKLKILIVEDDAIIAQLIEHHLMDFGYHVLDIAHDSERALDKIHTLQPDLVLLDINILGTKDGIDVVGANNLTINRIEIFNFMAGSFVKQADAHGIALSDAAPRQQ